MAQVGQFVLDYCAHALAVRGRFLVDGMVDIRESQIRAEVAAAAEAGLSHHAAT